MGALAGLLAITQAVEQSGVLQATARRLLARVSTQRRLALCLTVAAAALSALVTNDVSLFLLVPLTRVLATQAELPLVRLVVLQALAVNAGSALTPIALQAGAPVADLSPRLLAPAGVLLLAFIVALDRHALTFGLVLVAGALLVLRPRVLLGIDWALLAIIALMFVDLRQLAALPEVAHRLAALPIASGLNAYLAAVVTSQFIGNVPAAIALDRYVHDLPALAAGVSVGGFGLVIGSLANLIALRLAQLPKSAHALREFHKISIPFLIVCTASAALLRLR